MTISNSITEESLEEFFRLRRELFWLIDRELKIDDHHKGYEGKLAIEFPSRFLDDSRISIELACYVAPISGRSIEFMGETLAECNFGLAKLLDSWEDDLQEAEESGTFYERR